MADLTITELRRLRVAAHLLTPGGSGDVGAVARHLGALQAQDRAATRWSLGLRAGVDVAAVEAAVASRAVVRTWPMRGTLHWVPGEDARWMCRTLSGPAVRASRLVRERLGLGEDVVDRAAEVLDAAEGDLARPEVYAAWQARGIDTGEGRGYQLLVLLAERGLVVQAGMQGKQPTFAMLDRWVPHSRDLSGDEAVTVAVERYVRGHGPVHEKDVAGWWGGTLRDVRAAVAALGDRLGSVTHEGTTLLIHAEAEPPAGPVTVLLPAFDELLLGHKDRSAVLPPEHARAVVPGGNGVFLGSVLVDGLVVGTWRRQERADRVDITLSPFEPWSARTERSVEAAVASYGDFLGLPAAVV